jgi:hypothetical protein
MITLKRLLGNLEDALEWEEFGPVPHRWRELDERKRHALGRRQEDPDSRRVPFARRPARG